MVVIKGRLKSLGIVLNDYKKMMSVFVLLCSVFHESSSALSSSWAFFCHFNTGEKTDSSVGQPYIDLSTHLLWEVRTFPPICQCIYLSHTLPGITRVSSHTHPCVTMSSTWIWLDTYSSDTYFNHVHHCLLVCVFNWDISFWNDKILNHIPFLCHPNNQREDVPKVSSN